MLMKKILLRIFYFVIAAFLVFFELFDLLAYLYFRFNQTPMVW